MTEDRGERREQDSNRWVGESDGGMKREQDSKLMHEEQECRMRNAGMVRDAEVCR